ncbi:2-hydroxyacid dehydrogenase [Melittangium boletus]|uniref:Hydroxyacid dehydrogenase n=1 Tax=Melittangium boletus DSM 14713 TaxID=1294270 RepID=A0A250IH20_9BACT|nr:2-hydroxyacid dehydrogenase [Melittangium boletus]ATB30462.1 hypothetical protein MEBOL_003923 [Melittangium boletus DSM 14713]
MTFRLLQNGRLLPALESVLTEKFDTHPLWREADPSAFLARHGSEFSGLVTSARLGADAALIDALPGLKVIATFGIGHDAIDLEAARRRGIAVSNTPGVLTDCVADLAFGALLDVARGLSAADRFVRRGDWSRGPFPLTTRVSGRKLGILGLGRIGGAIARRASGFDMEVRYCNRRPSDLAPYRYEPSLSALARWADFLVVSCAGGAETRHRVDAGVLAELGPRGFLVNVSRGSVVEEAALVEALVHQRIAGAALDVFEHEPHVPSALLSLDTVVLLPHLASGTQETRQAMADLVLANLERFVGTGTLLTPVLG